MSKLRHSSVSNFTSAKIFDSAIYIGLLIFVLSLPFGYSTLFLNIGMLLVLLGWVGRIISERKLSWHHTAIDIPIALFLGLALVASLFAPHQASSSIGFFWKLLRAVLLFYAVIHSRLGDGWRHIVITFIVAAGVSSTLGLWYYFNDTRLGLDFMGQVRLEFQGELEAGKEFSDELRAELRQINVPLSESAAFTSAKQPNEWRIDDLSRDRRYIVRKDETQLMVYIIEQRLTGTFKMPNDLGAYLALSLPFVMGYFVVSFQFLRKRKNEIWIIFVLGAIVAVMTTNLALTLTRAAWVSVTIATACIGFYIVVKTMSKFQSVRDRWKRVLIGALIIVILGVSVFLMPQHIKSRFQTMIEQPAGFIGERPQWWRTSLELIRKYPLTGIGLGRFRYEYQLNGPPEQYNIPYHAHNIYLHIAVEHGIPSLFLFLWMLVIIWRRVFAIRSAVDTENDFWRMGAFIGGSGFLISALIYGLADNILHQRTVLLFWFIIGIIFYIQIHKDEQHEKKLETD